MNNPKAQSHRVSHQHWPADSAGSKMTTRVPLASPSQTINDVLSELSRNAKRFETISYIYVVDGDGKLVGVFPIEDIYRHPPETEVKKLIHKSPPVAVTPATDQEKAVYLALEHELKAVPVVDEAQRFLGVIPTDAILSIIHREAREDLLHLAGVHPSHAAVDNILEISLFQAFKHRFPWLFIGLLGGVFAAQIVGFFEHTLESNLLLASFIPLIVYMADAVGTQMEAFAIRDFTIFTTLNYTRYFLKQFLVVLIISLVTAGALVVIGLALYRETRISLVLGLSLFFATMSAMFTGLIIPYAFNKLGIDPANASGPIATIIQDILSVVIYFAIATWLLNI